MDDAEIAERLAATRLLRLPLVRFDNEVAAGKDEATWKRWLTRRAAEAAAPPGRRPRRRAPTRRTPSNGSSTMKLKP